MMEAAPAGRSLFFFQHSTQQFGQIPLRAASRTKAAAAQRHSSSAGSPFIRRNNPARSDDKHLRTIAVATRADCCLKWAKYVILDISSRAIGLGS